MHYQNKIAIQPVVASLLKEHRKSMGISQEAMARLLHVSVRAYIDLEHGLYVLSTTTLVYFLSLLSKEQQIKVIEDLIGLLP